MTACVERIVGKISLSVLWLWRYARSMKSYPVRVWLWLALFVSLVPVLRAASEWPLPATTPAAEGFSSERLDRLHQNLARLVDEGKYSGFVTLLARDGKIVDWRAHGRLDVSGAAPIQKDSIVRIFSMSKLITSTAVLMLMEDGKLKLDDPVEKYLPALKNRKVYAGGTPDQPVLVDAVRPITLRDLLTHTSGYYYPELWSGDAPNCELMNRAKVFEAANLDDFVARVATVPLHQQPGTRFRYGISTDLLGAVVEKVSGQRLDRFFQERIFTPLGLRDTGFWVPADKLSRMARVHARGADGKLAPVPGVDDQNVGPDHGLESGGGGLYSTAADYARFAQMLLNGGQLDGTRLLSRKTVELMTQNHLTSLADPHPFGARSQGFGLGVRIVTNLGESPMPGTLGTFGWDGAATTCVQIDPKEHTVALVLFQHFPFNQDDVIGYFTNGYYTAISD